DTRWVQIGDYLNGLIGELENTLQVEGRTATIRLSATGFPMSTDKVASLGVIVTELITNALKYAYVEREPGEVRIGISNEDGVVRLVVEDDGVGWTGVEPAKGTGLGSRIVRAMAHSLSAKVSYGEGPGTR